MNKIEHIFFDMGYTLVNEDKAWAERCKEQAATKEALTTNISAQTLMTEIKQASALLKPQWKTVVDKFGFKYSAKYKSEFETLYDDTLSVLDILHKQFKLGIIANQSVGFSDRLKYWRIDKYFSVVVASCDYGISKPDKRLFIAALEQSDCSACNAVMIGDRLDNDILPANNLGFQTVHVKQGFGKYQIAPSAEYKPTFSVNNLTELLHLPFIADNSF